MFLATLKFLIIWQPLRLQLNYMQDVLVSDAEKMEEGNRSKDHNHIQSQFHINIHKVILLLMYPNTEHLLKTTDVNISKLG